MMKFLQKNAFFIGVYILLAVFYFFSRFIHLTIIPVFVDEAIYTHWSQIIRSDGAQSFIPLSDGKQPLFMWLGAFFMRFIHDPLFAERSVSVVAGFFTMFGLFLLMKKLFSARIGLIASILYILCPFLFFYDRLAVADGLLTTGFVYCALLFVYLAEYLQLDSSLLLGGTLGLGLLTKSTAALSLFAAVGSVALIRWQRNKRIHQLLHFGVLTALSVAIAYLIYSILRLSPLFYLINQRTPDFIFTPKEILSHPFDPFLGRFSEVAGWLSGYLTFPVFVLTIAGIYLMVRKAPKKAIFLLAWFLIPLLIEMEIAKGFTPRYFIFVAPFALSFTSYFIERIVNVKRVFIPIFAVLLIPAVLFEYQLLINPERAPIPAKEKDGYLEEWSAGYGLTEISAYLKQQALNGKPITVKTEGSQGYGTLPDGLQIYLRNTPSVTVAGVNWATIAKVPNDLISDAKIHPAYLVVNDDRFFDKRSPYIKLIASYPKANGKNPLLFYQVVNP